MWEKTRTKSWDEKTLEVRNCFYRCSEKPQLANLFYRNLFFLNPKIKKYFTNTDWTDLRKALVHGIDHLIHFSESEKDKYHKNQIARLASTHAKKNLNIHPHDYYYWIDALILTLKELDDKWYDDLEYYLRECLFYPISFMISLYHK